MSWYECLLLRLPCQSIDDEASGPSRTRSGRQNRSPGRSTFAQCVVRPLIARYAAFDSSPPRFSRLHAPAPQVIQDNPDLHNVFEGLYKHGQAKIDLENPEGGKGGEGIIVRLTDK